MSESHMDGEFFSDNDWLDRVYRKSKSLGTRACAESSLRTFDQFCKYRTKMNGESKNVLISQYQSWFNREKPDIRSICMSLDKFVSFMDENHDDLQGPIWIVRRFYLKNRREK